MRRIRKTGVLLAGIFWQNGATVSEPGNGTGRNMKTLMTSVVLAIFAANLAQAGVIERACMSADRKAANRNLCGCIQDVADATLSRSDQRLAAKLFKKPEMAQEIRQSDSATHESFWKRYKEFGASAKTYCG